MNIHKEKIPCTVAILTHNSSATLPRALDSVRNFSEIIVCDGASTDDTLNIARTFNARILRQDKQFLGKDGSIQNFAGVRNQTLSAASHDWFFFLDSDEYISDSLGKEIRKITERGGLEQAIFNIPRKYVKENRIIDCATTYPNYQVRFFNKKAVNGFIRSVHEKIEPKSGFGIVKLQNCEYVPLEDVKSLKEKWGKYLEIEKNKEGEEDFLKWFLSGLLYHLAVSALYFFRYIKIILFCKGNRMPLPYEILRLWYNFEVIKIGFHRVIKGYRRRISG